MSQQQKRKFSKEYKDSIKEIFLIDGFEEAYKHVIKEFPRTTKRTVKSWVDEDYSKRVKDTRSKSYEKAKQTSPEKVSKWRKTSYENEKERRHKDPELKKERVAFSRSWAQRNPDRVRELDRNRWSKPETKKKRYTYVKKRKEKDLAFHIKENARSRAHGLLKQALENNIIKHCNTSDFFGCSLEYLAEHLRAQYKPGMTDKNYGTEWHLDHIKPCSLFDQTDEKQFLECWHYSNLQPLWAAENLAKSDKYQTFEETN